MLQFAIRRILYMIPTLFIVSIISFVSNPTVFPDLPKKLCHLLGFLRELVYDIRLFANILTEVVESLLFGFLFAFCLAAIGNIFPVALAKCNVP